MQVTPKATGFQNLGLELLAQVLEHVPQDYRLYDCAVVCKTWRQAANMATSTASSTLRCCTDQDGLNSLTAWLRRNSSTGKLSSITVGITSEYDVKPILTLPAKVLGQLQQLSLSSCALKMSRVMPNSSALAATAPFTASAAASMVPAVTSTAESAVSPATSALSALQSLYLHSVQLDLSDFGSCTGLQCLWAYDVSHIAEQRPASGSAESTEMKNGVDVHAAAEERTRTYGVNHLAPQLMNALPYLTRLTSLTLEGRYDVHRCQQTHSENSANSSTATVSLSSLRPLRSMHLSGLNIAALGFTQLPLNLTSLQIFRSSSVTRWTMPELQELTKLQYLRITAVQQVDAVLLSRLVQLTELDLSNTRFSRNFAVDELFQAIRQMEQLQDLRLTSSLAAEPSHPELYAALTASRRLQWLDITRCKIAAKAVGYVFPETCPVNSLRYVAASAELFLSTGSFEKLTSCCPGLQQLEIDDRSMCTQRVSHPDWKVSLPTSVVFQQE